MSLQKFNVFALERFSAVMPGLVVDVIGDTMQMRIRNRKRAEAFLPTESTSDPPLLVDVIGRTSFDVANQI
jgi:hypothetical protein